MRVTAHYLAAGSPRHLPLSHATLASVLHGLQHTTHPSAFAPVIDLVEAHLRYCVHPNFVRWSICNGNAPRVVFVRTMGVICILLGFTIAALLTLSRASRYYRFLGGLLSLPGLTALIAAWKGLCVILYNTDHRRTLKPWEGHEGMYSFDAGLTLACSRPATDSLSFNSSAEHFNTFGGSNEDAGIIWAQNYKRKSLFRKVFDDTVAVQEQAIQVLQQKIVGQAFSWAFIINAMILGGMVGIPAGKFY